MGCGRLWGRITALVEYGSRIRGRLVGAFEYGGGLWHQANKSKDAISMDIFLTAPHSAAMVTVQEYMYVTIWCSCGVPSISSM